MVTVIYVNRLMPDRLIMLISSTKPGKAIGTLKVSLFCGAF